MRFADASARSESLMADPTPGPEIIVDTDDGIATITLNRPDRLNAWTPAMGSAIRHALGELGADDRIRAIILTGAGRGFCAGAEMSNLSAVAAGDMQLPEIDPALRGGDFERQYSYLLAIPKPVIAAINGPAAGVGFVLGLFSDIRYMAQGAKISAVFARRGLIAEHGAAWILPRLIGPMAALELLMSGRTLDADGAERLGLAHKLPDAGFIENVRDLTRALVARSSPRSIAVIKRQVHQAWRQSLAEAVADAEAEQVLSLRSEDFREGVAHFVERREPQFTGR